MTFKRKLFKPLAVFSILTAFLVGGYYLVRGTDITVPSLFRPAPGPRLIMSMEGFRYSQAEQGGVSWRMQAQSADLYESKEAQLKEIEIEFKTQDRREATLLGDSGTLDTVSGNASVRSGARDVRIRTSDGYLLTTSSLFWKAGERVVRTPDPFKLLGREIYLEGRGMSADVDMRTLAVNNHVKAVLQEEPAHQ